MSKYNTHDETIRLFDSVSNREVDLIMAAILECAADSHIPELYEIFGKDMMFKFLDIFSGCTITCPTRRVVQDAIRDVGIFFRVRDAPDGKKARMVRDLASRYGIASGVVRRICMVMEQRMQRYKIAQNATLKRDL